MPPLQPDTRPSGAVHDSTLPRWAVDKMARRRGRRYAFETIDPPRTALVVVDLMQSYIAQTPCAASIVKPVTRIANSLRNAGGVVAWVYPAPMSTANPMLEALWGARHLDKNIDETADPAFADGLVLKQVDVVVEKHSYSAFFPGLCALPEMLSERAVETVIITGV
jgi:nicotinamidase-related amidase